MSIEVIIIGIVIVVALIVFVMNTNEEQSGISDSELLEKQGRTQYDENYDEDDFDAAYDYRHFRFLSSISSRKRAVIVIIIGLLGTIVGFIGMFSGYDIVNICIFCLIALVYGICKFVDPNDKLR